MSKTPAIVLLLSMALAATASAQSLPMSPELKAYLARPEQQQAYNEMIRQQWLAASGNCMTSQRRDVNVLVDQAPTFNPRGEPVAGRWRVVGRVDGCGLSRTLTVQYSVGRDGQLVRLDLLPGTTAANALLQREASSLAILSMVPIAPKNCTDVAVSDTKFVAFNSSDAAATGKRPWTEQWTVRACGVTGQVTVQFTPTASGTTISTRLSEKRKIGP